MYNQILQRNSATDFWWRGGLYFVFLCSSYL